MSDIIVYNDNHWFSPIEIKPTIGTFVREFELPNVYSAGDNFDLANCAMDQVKSIEERAKKYSEAMGERWIDGNHERGSIMNNSIQIEFEITDYKGTQKKKAVILHGDFESWGATRAMSYRSKPHGTSAFKRLFTKAWNDFYDKFFNNKITAEFLTNCCDRANKYGADLIIVGHKHVPETKRIFISKNLTVIVLKRGRNELNLSDEYFNLGLTETVRHDSMQVWNRMIKSISG